MMLFMINIEGLVRNKVALAKNFHIQPSEIDKMSMWEYEMFMKELNEQVKEENDKQQGEDQAVYNPILSDRFIQIASGESSNNRYVPYFQNTTSNTQAPLVPDNGKFPHDCTDPVQRKWSTSSTIRQSGEYTWVTYVYINSLNYPQLWVTPICITGENGEDGVDTTKREFIYRTSTTAQPNFYVPDTSLNQDGYVPSGWSNSPNGVNEINQYEWMCYRDKANDVWSKWKPLGDNQKPLIWSHFGVNGTDADAILTLDTMAERICIMESEPERSKEMRRLLVDNYSVFFVIQGDNVIVTDVLYSASDIESRLKGQMIKYYLFVTALSLA